MPAADATNYRGLAARANYRGQDRSDLFDVKIAKGFIERDSIDKRKDLGIAKGFIEYKLKEIENRKDKPPASQENKQSLEEMLNEVNRLLNQKESSSS